MNTDKVTGWSVLLASAVGEEAAFRVMCMPAARKAAGRDEEKSIAKRWSLWKFRGQKKTA